MRNKVSLFNPFIISSGQGFLFCIRLLKYGGPRCPKKFVFFLWLLHFNKALTTDNLQKRGAILANQCVMCGCSEETSPLLFLHCYIARSTWMDVLFRFHLSWVMSAFIPQVFVSWFHGPKGILSPRGKILWASIPHVLGHLVWVEQAHLWRKSFTPSSNKK